MAKNKYLLIEDVENLGRSGDVVTQVKPGYARNYLLPQKLAVVADAHALKMQERLKKERDVRAIQDKKESEEIAARLEGFVFTTVVKVDHEGHMYGSVTATDILHLIQNEHRIELDKRGIQLKHPIKELGVYPLEIKLKEGIMTNITVKVISEEEHQKNAEVTAS